VGESKGGDPKLWERGDQWGVEGGTTENETFRSGIKRQKKGEGGFQGVVSGRGK